MYYSRGKFLRRAFARSCGLPARFRKRWLESSAHDRTGTTLLPRTMVLVQEGTRIQEVPLIVRRTADVETLLEHRKDERSLGPSSATTTDRKGRANASTSNEKHRETSEGDVPTRSTAADGTRAPSRNGVPLKQRTISIETDEGTAILVRADIERLQDATDVERILGAINAAVPPDKGIYSLLESKMANEISCRIALQGLRKIIELENEWHRYRRALSSRQRSADAVNRDVILRRLVNLITESRDNETILQGLRALKRDRFSPSRNIYKDWMCNAAMIRATDGEFTVAQLIRVVRILASYKDPRYRSCVDALWAGLACRERDIKPDLLAPLFRSLKYFRQSESMVQIILEKKLSEQWLQLTGSQMAGILDSLYGRESSRCLTSASKWASVSMTTSTERDLANFIRSLHARRHVDEHVEQALERYVTVKGGEMKDPNLVAAVMDYCKDLKVRNPRILAECGGYFIKHGTKVSPSLLPAMLAPFGLLNVQPPDATEFWRVHDEALSAGFTDLKLNDVLDILLSCTYLERYPIGFLDRVFNSYLLNRLQIQRDMPVVNGLRTKLMLFDTTMSLECKDYQGTPVNIGTNAKLLHLDVRIRGIVNRIYKPLAHLVGGEQKLSRSVVLGRLPLVNFYVLDILVHPLLKSMPVFNLNLHKKRNVNTAILVHLPEHYCWNARHLTGPQVMRKRQIRKLGFRVTCLDYARLTELVDRDDKLLPYLSQSLDAAEDAL